MGFASYALARCLSCLVAAVVVTVGAVDFPYVGPKPCPKDRSVLGYYNSTTLFWDMMMINNAVAGGRLTLDAAERVYTLCPQTFFHLGENLFSSQEVFPLTPFLPGTAFRCGNDGKLENECVIRGGYHQVMFEDDIHGLRNISFAGIRFEKSEDIAILAFGHPITDMTFTNCKFEFHKGLFVVVSMWEEDMDFFLEKGNARRETRRHLEDILGKRDTILHRWQRPKSLLPTRQIMRKEREEHGEEAMHTKFVGCRFANNKVEGAVVANAGGSLEIDRCTFHKNKGAEAVVASIKNSALSIYGSSSFDKNKDMRLGPIFLDKSSALVRYDEDTTGSGNIASSNDCQGVFIEAEGASCAANQSLCDGSCCEFGDTSCVMDESQVRLPTSMTATKIDKKCGVFCIFLVVILPVVFFVIGCVLWSACRTRQQVASANQSTTGGLCGDSSKLEIPEQAGQQQVPRLEEIPSELEQQEVSTERDSPCYA